MIRLFQRWALTGCLSAACLWAVGCDSGSSTTAPAEAPANQGEAPAAGHESTDAPAAAPAGEGEPAATPEAAAAPEGEPAAAAPAPAPAPAKTGSNLNFGDL